MSAAAAHVKGDRFAHKRELIDAMYSASLVMNDIADLASQLDALLVQLTVDASAGESPARDCADAAAVARVLCSQIGWIADHAADTFGGGIVRGGGGEWLLSPAAAKAVADVGARLKNGSAT